MGSRFLIPSSHTYHVRGDLVSLAAQTGGEAVVSADTAVALSRALNELITNS